MERSCWISDQPKRWSLESSGESRGCSRANLRSINTCRDAERNTQIRWRLIESDPVIGMWTVPFGAEFAQISTNNTIRRWIHERLLNQRNSPPGITSPEYPSRKIRRRSYLQGTLADITIRKAKTDRWWILRSYVANELFNKSHYEADYKSHYKLITRAITSWLQEPLHNSKMLWSMIRIVSRVGCNL